MDGDVESRGQRARLTCTACHRRKIKCDKNIPCDTCIRRGIADSCHRDETIPSAATPYTPGRPTRDNHGGETPVDTVQSLLQRVSQLEARLRGNQSPCAAENRHAASVEPVSDRLEARPQSATSTVADTTDAGNSSALAADELDAATVLEFLAWGRKKDSDFITAPEHDSGPRQPKPSGVHPTANSLAEDSATAQLDVLGTLLPGRSHVAQLVAFHNHSVLWYHGSYCSSTFSSDLDIFFNDYGADIRHSELNLQWLALLFAILTGSMTCASRAVCQDWGFSAAEQPVLASRWYEAAIACLNMSGYIEVHTVYSVQAIATMTISAHILGKSNSQSVLLASAGRIAQSLGLHRLENERGTETDASIDERRKSEAGKRLFIQLCTQDWFSIPFSETYALSPRFISNKIRPLNCNDDDMVVQPESIPTQASYCNYRFDIASLIPQLLDAMSGCNTPYTRYEQVLKFDDKMRKLATASMPTFLNHHAPVHAEWPAYVGWARRSLTICASHKIIMIHRKFIGLSFTNSAFAFTRRTCLAAAKTILREALTATSETDPVLWIDQAFSVAAGIILSLDMLHRDPTDQEFGEHKELITDTIQYLQRFDHNKIATRGVELLSLLQQKVLADALGRTDRRKRRRTGTSNVDRGNSSPPRKRTRDVNMSSVIRDISQNLGVTSPEISSTATPTRSMQPAANVNSEWHSVIDLLPDQMGFDSQYLFDNFFPL